MSVSELTAMISLPIRLDYMLADFTLTIDPKSGVTLS